FLREFGLLAANDQLAALDRDVQFIATKASDSKRNAQLLFFGLLDIVGRIAVCRSLGSPFEEALEVLETEQKRAVEVDCAVHLKALLQAALGIAWSPRWATDMSSATPVRASPSSKNVGCCGTKSRPRKALL